ncbi:MAG: bifunctional UDP-sugar hydrolase/5'-nucleotidase [Verrucomicrobiota bacterium]
MKTMQRRHFLKGTILSGAAAGLPARIQAAAEGRELVTVSVFHTTDLHGHILPTSNYQGDSDLGGLARCASQIRKWRSESPHHLLVDIGDVYQGTPVGWRTRGRLMIELFNKLGYDAWVMGNHEFDWGPEVVVDAIKRSRMPVLNGNLKLEGKLAGSLDDPGNPLAKVLPHTVKQVGGIKIGLIGMITPGLPYWLPEELRKGFEVLPPEKILQSSVKHLREVEKVAAVVALGHFGLRDEDDFANPTRSLLETDNGVDVFIAGHTHRNHPQSMAGQSLYTQADYFGIHCGRVDLVFDAESSALLERKAITALMDSRIDADPLVLEVAGDEIDEARSYLKTEVGRVKGIISGRSEGPGQPSQLQRLIASSLEWAAARDEIEVDGVFHGTFGSGDLESGPIEIADLWKVLPYENQVVVLHLTREEILAILNESLQVRSDRALYGFEVEVATAPAAKFERSSERFVRSLRCQRRPDAPVGHRYRILCNAYDAQSGGKRLMRLRTLAQSPEVRSRMLSLSSREALIEFFKDRGEIESKDLEVTG